MTKNSIRKVLCFAIAICLLSTCAFAAEPNSDDVANQLRYSRISYVAAGLTISSIGLATCTAGAGKTYTSDIGILLMELQQYTGGYWGTINPWYDTTSPYLLNGYYYVNSGYYYRVKSTFRVYDANGNLLESATAYSSSVYY